jgi:hypothetical protein
MKSTARFSVDPQLSALLGESYTSSERALRELVDNAWDAEARVVKITLPMVLSEEPVVIEDDGHGMKNQEVRQEYLKIASPRFSRKGERTPNLDRKVKGRRGIGKFSGLTIGDEMEIVTRAQGVKTTLVISKELLLEAGKDIEDVDLPISEESCEPEAHGTTITIRKLNPRLSFPQPDKLREQVAYDYGRETGIQVQINGNTVLRHDVLGTTFTKEYEMPDGTKAEATWTVTEKPLPGRKAGLILRSGDKSVGKPHHWGLEHDEQLSNRLINRVVGEVRVGSETNELTASGGDVIESDKGHQKLTEAIQADVRASLTEIHGKEVALARGRWTQTMKRRLEAVPEHRRAIAEEKLERLISRSYQEGEKEERITTLINLVLDALEMDEYWTVCREIEEAEKSDVFIFANALDKFGLSDLAFIAHQADRRRAFLDGLDDLAKDPKTTEAQMHTALQHNLWIFGNEYSLMASNRQLQSIIRDFTEKAYAGKDAADRPDLLLAANVENRHLLLEFKRPLIPVGRDAEHQAVKYADTLTGELGLELDILIVGGSVDPKLQSDYSGKKTRFLSYRAVIANARTQLEWLIKQLNEKP